MANPDSTYNGSSINDSFYGASGRDLMMGYGGNDSLSGNDGDDTLLGGDGNDTLVGGNGNDSLLGEAGSDTLIGNAGNDTLDGGAILDRTNLTDLNFTSYSTSTAGVNVNLATGVATDGLSGTDSLVNINFVQGSAYNDTLTGSSTFNLFEQFEGMAGNDVINGGAIDPITGNNGNRAEYGSSPAAVNVNLSTGTALDGFGGTDTLLNINQVRGSNFNDTLTGSDTTVYTEAFQGRAGNDTIDGKGGNDQVRYDSATTGVNVNLVTGVAQDGQGGTDTLLNIEGIRGSNFADVLTGGNTLNGTGTTDGFEFFQGNAGNDTIDGGAGYDRVDYGSSTSGINVTLGGTSNGTAQDGLGGTDTLINIEAVRGSDFNDILTGSDTGTFESFEGRTGNDLIDGKGGDDRIDYSGDWGAVNVNMATGLAQDGFGGTDTFKNIERVRGSAFDDTIVGSAGNDSLEGYGGNDTLTGGAGSDTFIFAKPGQGVDLITDFSVGDTIRIDTLLSTATPTAGNGSAVTGKNIQVSTQAGVTTLNVDVDNVVGADEFIQLTGNYNAAGFTVTNTTDGRTLVTYSGAITSGSTLNGTGGNDSLVGGPANDSIVGGAGNDTLVGGNGNDTLLGQAGDDSLLGGAGSDFLSGEAGNDTIDGGAILDRINYTDLNTVSYITATSGIVLNLETGSVSDGLGGTDVVSNLNFVTGSNQGDRLTGSSTLNLFEQFEGMGGNDTIDGGAIDPITGNNANRVEYGASPAAVNVNLSLGTALDGFGGTDTLLNINHVRGSNFNDTLTGSDTTVYTEAFQGRAGNDTIDGKGGNDQVRYDSATTGVNVNLVTGVAQDGQGGTDTLLNIEGIRGSNFADVLTGGNTLNGSGATDGFEWFQGNGGNDTMDGGAGYDRVDYSSSTSGVNVTLGGTSNGTAQDGLGGTDTLINIEAVRGSDFNDILIGSDTGVFESFEGRAGNDTIDGKGGTDRIDYNSDWTAVNVNLITGVALDGFGGTDRLYNIENIRGSAFNDTLMGNSGNNAIDGRAGDDTLDGGLGSDTLTGGAGTDKFIVSYGTGDIDRITDLSAREVIALPGLTDNLDFDSQIQSGSDPSALTMGQIMVAPVASGVTRIWAGGDSKPGADLTVDLVGTYAAQDFVLAFTDNSTGLMYAPTGVNLTGTANSEWMYGSNYADTLVGGAGDDSIIGWGGNDSLLGQDGDDHFLGDLGTDTIDGGAGSDWVHYSFQGQLASGVIGNLNTGTVTSDGVTDTLISIENINGTRSGDTLVGTTAANGLEGDDGNDLILGQTTVGNAAGAAYVGTATAGDEISGGGGNDTLQGSTANDTLYGGWNDDYWMQGDGSDTFAFAANGNGVDLIKDFKSDDKLLVKATLSTAASTSGNGTTLTDKGIQAQSNNGLTTVYIDTDNVAGADITIQLNGSFDATGFNAVDNGDGSSTVTYTPPPMNLVGTSGNDSLTSGDGNDTLSGLDGGDTLTGGIGNDSVLGGSGQDTIFGGSGNDTLDGGTDFDAVDYGYSPSAVNVNLSTGSALDGFGTTDTLIGIEGVRGSNYNDTLTGDGNNNYLEGQGGSDMLIGGAGNDTLSAGWGQMSTTDADTMTGGSGSDLYLLANTINSGRVTRITDLEEGEHIQLTYYSGTTPQPILSGDNPTGLLEGQVMVGTTTAGITRLYVGPMGGVTGSTLPAYIDLVGSFTASSLAMVSNPSINGSSQYGTFLKYDPTYNLPKNLTGTTGNDTLNGGGGNDTLSGLDGSDQLNGYAGNDSLTGGTGSDYLDGGAGNDTLDGGADSDTATYGSATAGVNVNLFAGTAADGTGGTGGTDTLISIEIVSGSQYNDTLIGDSNGNAFYGLNGNDSIDGAGGSDIIYGDTGNDTLLGGAGDDYLDGSDGSDSLNGGAGNDTLDVGYSYTASDADTLTGGSDTDMFRLVNAINSGRLTRITDLEVGEHIQLTSYYSGSALQPILSGDNPTGLLEGQVMVGTTTAGITRLYVGPTGGVTGTTLPAYIDLVGSFTASSLAMVSNPTINGSLQYGAFIKYDPTANLPKSLTGTSGSDTLTGGSGNDTITGLDGSDYLYGNAGNDSLLGGIGSDYLDGGAGNDTLDGGADSDTTDYWSAGAAINVNLSTGTATDGTGGTDTLISIEQVFGSQYNDTLTGDANDNTLVGNSGNDSIDGGAGNDYLSGDSGNDTLLGGAGDDSLNGSDGNDSLSGGTGNDTLDVGYSYSSSTDSDTLTGGSGNDLFRLSNGLTSGRVIRITDLEVDEHIQLTYYYSGSAPQPILSGDNPAGLLEGQVMVGTSSGGVTRLYVGPTGGVTGTTLPAYIDLVGNFTASSLIMVSNPTINGNFQYGTYIKFDPTANLPKSLTGTSGDDTLTGGGGNDTISGLDGNDYLAGNAGNDSILGGAGDDFLDGGAGNDTLDGGSNGQFGDTVEFANAMASININLATGVVSNDGTGGVDTILNVEHINGTPFNDTMVGDGFNNWFRPGAGNDSVDGGAGTDVVMYEDATASVAVNLLTGQASGASIGNDTLTSVEAIHGSAYDDVLTLSNTSAYIFGRDGNDSLTGGSGDDNFTGGADNDTINGGNGTDQVSYQDQYSSGSYSLLSGVTVNLATGTATDNWGHTDTLSNIEQINGSDYSDQLTGGNPNNGSGTTDGFEGFRGNAGYDTIDGGAGFDRVYYDNSPNAVAVTLGGTSNGTASDGWGWTDTLINIEEVRASALNDTLTGSDSGAFESFEGRAGNDTIDGKGGTDRISYQTSPAAVTVNMTAGVATDGWGGTDTFTNIENVRGSDYNDSITGDANNNDLEGRAGNDTLVGGDGQDSLRGGAGNDVLDGGTQRILNGWDATANRSGQYDLAYCTDATSGVTVTLGADGTNGAATGGGDTDTLINIEMVLGSAYNDVIRGTNRELNEIIRGGAGDDTLYGGDTSGTDLGNNFADYRFGAGAVVVNLATGTASGADGNDLLFGFRSILSGNFNDSLTGDAQDNYFDAGAGNDTIDGGAGSDILSFQNATGGVSASLATGASSGADGNDTFINIEALRGSEFADTLTGDANANRIQGRDGADVINGGAGNDSLHGGYGNDTLTGGAGDDTFQYSEGGEGTDRITDFAASDVISVATTLTVAAIANGNGSTVGAGDVQISQTSGLTTLYIGTDTVVGADITIELAGTFNTTGFNTSTANGVSLISYSTANSAPTGNVTITGTATKGELLTAANTLADADGMGTVTYQWKAGGVSISGATGSTYTLAASDVGKAITVAASYTDGFGKLESVSSAATSNVSDGLLNLQGMAYHWKSHVLLGNVGVQALSQSATTTSNTDLFDLRGAQYDAATKTLTVQVWVNPSAATASLDLSASASNSSSVTFTSSLSADWTQVGNPSSGAVSFGAFITNTSNPGVTGALQVGTVSVVLDNPANGTNLSFSGLDIGSVSANNVTLSLASTTTGTPGTFALNTLLADQYALSVSRSASDSGSAITSADALAALRIAVGINPNADPDGAGPLSALALSPYQVMAADATKDGKVTSADALAILRMAVKLPSALPQEWFFVNESKDFWNETTNTSALTRSAAAWDSGLSNVNLAQNGSLNVVGVLKGDVNGSWAAPTGSTDLDVTQPAYFQLLGTQLNQPTDVWGV